MPGFTTRTLQHPKPPEQAKIVAAAEQAEIVKQALLKLGHNLDDSATRHLHRKALLAKASIDELSVELTEWVAE